MFEATRLALYVVTSGPDAASHVAVARAAISGGAGTVQVRATGLSGDDARIAAAAISEECERAGVLCIVNDDVELSIAVDADGVHVGQDDLPLEARARLGTDRVLGVSVDDPDQARRAEEAGADYLGVTVWATPTKPEARPIGIEGLAAIAAATSLPIVGIGGIDAGNAPEVLAAGAAGVAVVSAVAAAADPVRATEELMIAIERGRA